MKRALGQLVEPGAKVAAGFAERRLPKAMEDISFRMGKISAAIRARLGSLGR